MQFLFLRPTGQLIHLKGECPLGYGYSVRSRKHDVQYRTALGFTNTVLLDVLRTESELALVRENRHADGDPNLRVGPALG